MRTLLSTFALLAFALLSTAADPIDPQVEQFSQRLAKSGNKEELRQEIGRFVRSRLGTPASTQAGALLLTMRTPLDDLNPKNIPQLDQFGWQPKELVAVLGEHRGRHGSIVSAILWTPDGKRIISGGHNGYVRCWDPVTLRQQWRIAPGAATAMAISKDSKVLAVATATSVIVWDLSGETPVQTGAFAIATSGVLDVHISADGKHMAAGVYDGLVHLWHMEGAKATVRTQLSGHQSAVNAVRYSPGGMLTTADAKGEIRYWDTKTDAIKELGDPKKPFKASGAISRMDYAPSGQTIAMVVGGDSIELWTPRAAKPRAIIPKTSGAGGTSFVTFSPGGVLASAHADGTAKTWNLASMKPITVVERHFYHVSGVAWAPGGRQVATGSHDWTVRLWDVGGAKGIEKHILRGHWMGVSSTVFSHTSPAPNGSLPQVLATGGQDRTARIWDVSKATSTQYAQFPPTVSLYKGEAYGLSVMTFTPDGKHLATAGSSAAVRLWDVHLRKMADTYTAPVGAIHQLAYTPDGKILVGSYNPTVFAWNSTTGKQLYQFTGGDRYVIHVTFSPDARIALTGSGHYTYDKMNQPVIKDGRYVYQEVALRLFDLKQGKLIKDRYDLDAPPGAASFRPDGQPYVSLWREAPRMWEATKAALKEGKVMKDLNQTGRGHPYVFSPDGKTYLTATLNLVDAETGRILRTFNFDEQIYTYAFAPDGRHISVALVTGPIYILRLDKAP